MGLDFPSISTEGLMPFAVKVNDEESDYLIRAKLASNVSNCPEW